MAWEDHAPNVQHKKNQAGDGGLYYVEHPEWGDHYMTGPPRSYLDYELRHPDQAVVRMISTNFLNQHDGVAEAMIRRLHQDYPNHKINYEELTDDGQAFHDRMVQKEPDARKVLARQQFLAMAWEDWKDQIEHHQPESTRIAPEWPTGSTYFIRHPESEDHPESYNWSKDIGAFSGLTYDPHWQCPWDDGKKVKVRFLATHPDHRNDGVAEALMRRLHEDYPDHQISTGSMTHDGWDFKERMLKKEPRARDLVTAALIREAMAWQDWKDQIEHTPPDGLNENPGYHSENQGVYEIFHDTDLADSNLLYTIVPHSYTEDKNNSIYIDGLYTHSDFRNDGIAEALMRRLHEDYPNHRIDPGNMTGDGEAFHDRMIEKEPEARNVLMQAHRLAMAWEDWKDKITGGCESCQFEPGEGTWDERAGVMRYPPYWKRPWAYGRYVVPQAGAFLDFSHGTYMGQPELSVQGIYTHPSNRNDGVAEAMMRRLAEDHPGVRINPGVMTNDGQKFHDRMIEKDPEARDLVARRQFLAMAWGEWAPQMSHRQMGHNSANGSTFHKYEIDHGPPDPAIAGTGPYVEKTRGSSLSYWKHPDKVIDIDFLNTHPDFRNQGIAEAFMRKLHEDHPDHRIFPGQMTTSGRGFYDRMMEKDDDPRLSDGTPLLIGRLIREAMAWQDWNVGTLSSFLKG
jgi:GNAT superfamily N-acetyltransferase